MSLKNDKELADRVVALGVGEYDNKILYSIQHPVHKHWATHISADQFVRDWRVAGALMEKCEHVDVFIDDVGIRARASVANGFALASSDNWPRASIEACVEALDSVEQGLNDD